MQQHQQTHTPNLTSNAPIVNSMTNLSQITVKDLLAGLCKHITSTQLQNTTQAANTVDEVKPALWISLLMPSQEGINKILCRIS